MNGNLLFISGSIAIFSFNYDLFSCCSITSWIIIVESYCGWSWVRNIGIIRCCGSQAIKGAGRRSVKHPLSRLPPGVSGRWDPQKMSARTVFMSATPPPRAENPTPCRQMMNSCKLHLMDAPPPENSFILCPFSAYCSILSCYKRQLWYLL